ncbi:MAG: hypothetical protein QM214_02645 [Bacillota bacterium]|jgi:hypothetical protein|nr:hypothetical protein [Bacillota bacterium]HHU42976.1 hypothetical protein [Clostridiales bacterium]
MKKRLVYSIILFLFSLSVAVTAVAAWFTPSAQYIDNIIITAGTVDAQARLFMIEDFNKDGVPDLVDSKPVYTLINSIDIDNMIPQNVYSYKLDVKNTGKAMANLTVYFEDIEEGLRDVLTYRSVVKNSEGETIAGGMDKRIFSGQDIFAQVNGIEGEAEEYQVSVYFYIEFETLENLKILNPEVFGDKENLDEYQNLSFNIGKIIVKMEQAV